MKPFDAKLVMVALALATGVGKGAATLCCRMNTAVTFSEELPADIAAPTVSATFPILSQITGDVGSPGEPDEFPDFGDDVSTAASSTVASNGTDPDPDSDFSAL